MSPPYGVLLMAYGSPRSLEEIGAYYTHIRGGRPPSPELVAELRARYERIGGHSPLQEITARQAAGVQRVLTDRHVPAHVYVGMKHAPPFVEQTVAQMATEGIRTAVGIALAPHYSKISVASYFTTASQSAVRHGIALRTVESWHDHPGFIAALAARVRQARQRFGDVSIPVIFTAHSLPQRITTLNDPYPAQLHRTCELVAEAADLPDWQFAYQSASHTGEPWLGPDLLETLQTMRHEGHRTVLVCPLGFVADHLEVLYDIDVEAAELAASLGMRLERTPSLNDAPEFVAAVADLAQAHLQQEIPR